jgi:hypothetical protein
MSSPPLPDRPAVVAVERWFIRRGLPHFIDGYSAGTDIWHRALPILAIAYVAGGLNALDLSRWSVGRNLVAGLVALAILVLGLVSANVARGRPLLAVPRTIGPLELALFVVGPAVPPLIFGQPGDALQSVLTGMAVLIGIYVVTSYGLVSMTRWAATQLGDQIADLGRLVVKALPLLLLFVTFLFVNAEVWQVAGGLAGPAYWLVLGLFFSIGAVFVLSRVPADLNEINHFQGWEDARRLAQTTGAPVGALDDPRAGDGEVAYPLGRRAWANIVLVMLATQAIQVTLVALVMGGFFVLFGLLAIDRSVIETWTTAEAHVLWEPTLGGRELVLSEQLLRVSGFLAAFTALYFTVYLVTDSTYREQFRDDVVADVRGALAARACYLASLRN